MENKEFWKDIPNYEGLYQASTLGRIKSVKREIELTVSGKVQTRIIEERIMSCGDNGHGYMFVYLNKNGKKRRFYTHRLIAETFLPNPEHLLFINHKDENNRNNHLDNLEWCTAKYNANYGSHMAKVRAFLLSDKNPNRGKHRPEQFKEKVRKPIIQCSIDGTFIQDWDSALTAGNALGIIPSCITAVCKGKVGTYKKFKWKYKYDYPHTDPAQR